MDMEIRVRRPCSTLNVTVTSGVGPSGVQYDCSECGQRSYRRDGQMNHELVKEWISVEELRELLINEEQK